MGNKMCILDKWENILNTSIAPIQAFKFLKKRNISVQVHEILD